MACHAQHVLSRSVIRVDATESVAQSLPRFQDRQATHAAVFTQDKCRGASNLNDAQLASVEATYEELLRQKSCPVVSDTTPLEQLGKLFADSEVDALVVQDGQGAFLGLVTRQSLLEAVLEERSPGCDSHRPYNERNANGQSSQSSDPRQQPLMGVTVDEVHEVTEPGPEQQALHDREVKFRGFFEMGLVGLAITSPEKGWIEVNQRLCEILGYPQEELMRKTWEEVTHPDDLEANVALFDRVLAGETDGYSLEKRFIQKDGTVIHARLDVNCWRREDGSVDYFFAMVQDVTERKRAEEALRDSEIRSRTLLEGSPVCNKIIDLDLRLQYMSCAGRDQLKINDITPFYGCTFPPDLYSEPMKQLATEHLKLAKAGETSTVECAVHDTDGNEVWYDTTFVPARDEEGQIEYIIVTSVNITERKAAEAEARKHLDELAHVSRVSTMGEMATGIAHELNQPLTAVASYGHAAKLALDNGNIDREQLRSLLEKLEDQAIRAGEIVRRLRGFVNKSEKDRTSIDLNTLARDVVKLVDHDIREMKARVKLDLDNRSPRMQGDEIQVQQVLVNLIRNALDAMQETEVDERTIVVSTRELPNGQSELTVKDSGKGLPTENVERVFDAFYSSKPAGMGMGLAISRSIIEGHGGKLWAKQNSHAGMTFGLTIPADHYDQIETHEPTGAVVDGNHNRL